jgi:PadR family transcriptional regulator
VAKSDAGGGRAGAGDARSDLVRGTLEMLILKALVPGPLHGLGVARRIAQITRGAFEVGPGSLFPALHRMQAEGWLVSAWSESENRRRAKFYTLTKDGRRQLEHESKRWGRVSLAIARALEAT